MRRVNLAILRSAALLVPVPERREWLAEWSAELCYVTKKPTAFCVGSLRDALWFRTNHCAESRHAFEFESPVSCILFMFLLATLSFVSLFRLPSHSELLLPSCSELFSAHFLAACGWMFLLSLLPLPAAVPLNLGHYPTNRFAPAFWIRSRRWFFLVIKIALLGPISVWSWLFFLPLAPWLMWLSLVFGMRWALSDQRRRCPVCLCLLGSPTQIGDPAQAFLGWYGTELICRKGHGLLYIPGTPTSWCSTQRWQYLDSPWASLRS